jgi:hypothetical protein
MTVLLDSVAPEVKTKRTLNTLSTCSHRTKLLGVGADEAGHLLSSLLNALLSVPAVLVGTAVRVAVRMGHVR